MNHKTHPATRARALALALLLAAGGAQAQGQETVRNDIARPLQAAQELIKAGRYKDALAKVREADAVANQTPYEKLVLDRLRGSAAAGAGDDATLSRSFEAALASGRLQPVEALPILEALAGAAYRQKDYVRAIDWADRYAKQGGTSEQMFNLKTNARYQAGDYAGVVRDMEQKVAAIERSVPTIDENTLRTLAAGYAKLGDEAGYAGALEKLLVHHPKKDYWEDRLTRLQADPGFPDRLLLDLYRLRRATDTLSEADQYIEMATLAVQAGLPAEAKRVVDAGYAGGKLGEGPEAARHTRLRDMVNKHRADLGQRRPARQGHRPAGARHRQGRPEAPRRRAAAPGRGLCAGRQPHQGGRDAEGRQGRTGPAGAGQAVGHLGRQTLNTSQALPRLQSLATDRASGAGTHPI
jgi:hypothetical protein